MDPSNYKVDFNRTLSTFPVANSNELDQQPLSDEWILHTLAPLLEDVYISKKSHRIFIFIDGHLSTIVILTFYNKNVLISRSEFCNLGTHLPPLNQFESEQLLALPYELYSRVTRLKNNLVPFEIERLWGWGYCCDVHGHVRRQDFSNYDSIEHIKFWGNADFKDLNEYDSKQVKNFIHSIKQWSLYEQERLTYVVQ